MKKDIKIGVLGIIGILVLIVMVSGCTSSDNSTNQTSTQSSAPPVTTTISGIYSNAPAVGTKIQVSGTVLQSATDFIIIRNSNLQEMYVTLDSSNTKTAYEDQNVTVTGSFAGPVQYTTVNNAPRTIPGIDNGIIS